MDILNKFVGRDLTKVTIRQIHELEKEIEKTYTDIICAITSQGVKDAQKFLIYLGKLRDIRTNILKANRMKNIKIDKKDLIDELYKELDL